MIRLEDYGFTPDMTTGNITENIARVTAVYKERYALVIEYGEIYGRLKASVYYTNTSESFPTIGDFLMIKHNPKGDSQIIKTLERKTKFSRTDYSGHAVDYVKTVKEQVVAANFDLVFIMQSFNHDWNTRRLERYLTLAWRSGATPMVLLTKSDLMADSEVQLESIKRLAVRCEVHVISARTGYGLDSLSIYLQPDKTIVFLGLSGVGKASLVNALAEDEIMAVREIREKDSRGQHTTSLLNFAICTLKAEGFTRLGVDFESFNPTAYGFC